MKILAFDTSTEYCSVALWADGEVSAREVLAGQRHSELLLPLVGEMLAERGMNLQALDGIAFGSGPGSFTGLRIGCGVAQGLAFAAGLPVIGMCTLLALAQGADSERVIACLDARVGEVYHAAYEREADGWRVVQTPGLYAPQDTPRVAGEGWSGCGSGFAAHGEALRGRHAGQLQRVFADAFPLARDIARLAAPCFANGEGVDAALAAPLYIRNKVALKTSER
ncbi:MAG: tRNA (adenosine(37)-N6)-threonylcarbamoyltransferase complex dimerization subunit type 1 TsaB [Sulfuricellaceae bacterium]